jgi:rod shape-determining protein MreD
MHPLKAQSQPEIQHPIKKVLIVLSVVTALILNGLPWSGIWLMLRPDFVALVLLYWCMHKPWRFGIGLSWMVGILADASDASLFGQHALAYTLLAFGGVVLNNRLRMFDLRQQTIQVFAILTVTYLIYAIINWQTNGYVVWGYFLGCLTSTALWIPTTILLRSMQQKRPEQKVV